MKKIALAGSVALLTTCLYVWGSKPDTHIASNTQPTIHNSSVTDTVPKKSRDTLNKRDTMTRRDSIQ